MRRKRAALLYRISRRCPLVRNGAPEYRAANSNPLRLEPVLIRQPGARLVITLDRIVTNEAITKISIAIIGAIRTPE